MQEKASEAIKDMTFEQAMQQMEILVEKMGSGQLPLAESVSAYEQGKALAEHCEKLLSQAQAVVEKLENEQLQAIEPDELREE